MALEEVACTLEDLFPSYSTANRLMSELKKVDAEELGKLEPIDADDVKNALLGKKNRITAPRPDGVLSSTWRLVGPYVGEFIAAFFNKYIKTGEFPSLWKETLLVLIPKPTETNTLPKYKQICLLDTIAKTFERILIIRILNIRIHEALMSLNGAGLSSSQYGFREGRSTEALLKVQTFVHQLHWTRNM